MQAHSPVVERRLRSGCLEKVMSRGMHGWLTWTIAGLDGKAAGCCGGGEGEGTPGCVKSGLLASPKPTKGLGLFCAFAVL